MALLVNSYIPLPSPRNALGNVPEGIDDAGNVSGTYTTPSGGSAPYALLLALSPAETFSFPSHPGWNILHAGTTNNGASFGQATEADGSVPFGYIESNGNFTVLPSGQFGSRITGMNDNSMAVGFNTDAQGKNHPFTYDMATGMETSLVLPNLTSTVFTGINDSGHWVGFGLTSTDQTLGFVEDAKGNFIGLPIPGATETEAFGMNNIGQIVGDYLDAAGKFHGFLFDSATNVLTTVDYPNATATHLTGINDFGHMVGSYTDAQGSHGFEALIAHT